MMLSVTMDTDGFGGLACELTDGSTHGVVRASNADQALDDLRDTLKEVEAGEKAECFWLRESGAYRWLFRREQENVQLVVLWSGGTLTGWENVFWTTCPWSKAVAALRVEVEDCKRRLCAAAG